MILGWYGSNNTGDEALVEGDRDELKEHGFDDLVILSTNPEKSGGAIRRKERVAQVVQSGDLQGAARGEGADISVGEGDSGQHLALYNLPVYAFMWHCEAVRAEGNRVGAGSGAAVDAVRKADDALYLSGRRNHIQRARLGVQAGCWSKRGYHPVCDCECRPGDPAEA